MSSDTAAKENTHLLDEDNSDVEPPEDDLPGSSWLGYWVALVPLIVCMFGAGRESWSMSIASTLAGMLLLIFAPQRQLPRLPKLCGLLALAAPLLSFLPLHWLRAEPAWRKFLTQDWQIQLSDRVTPQVDVTLEAWLLFAFCIIWLLWCLTRGFSSSQRRAIIYTFALGGSLLCLLSMLEKQGVFSISWWPRSQQEWGDGFGPFANRNHISSLAAISCVLCAASALDAHRRKSRLWMVLVLGFLVPVATIFMNTSRAGVILMFLGLTVWLGTAAMGKGFVKKLAVSTSLILCISTLLVISGGGVGKRLTTGKIESLSMADTRLSLFGESLRMMLDAPWLGTGLGNFSAVFPLQTTMHEPRTRFLHPESDLLWLLTEGGLLCVLPGLLLLIWIFRSTGPWFVKKRRGSSSRQDRRLRNAAAIAFGLGALHGLMDVPNHGLGYALFMGVLAGAAVRPRRLQSHATWMEGLSSRAAGLGILILSGCWAAISNGHPVLSGSSAAQNLRHRANRLADQGSYKEALNLMSHAIRMAPMNFSMYFERAHIRLDLGEPAESALLDFSRSRALEPHYAYHCYAEGVLWLDHAPNYAVIGWREFLRRYPSAATGRYGYYRMMLSHASRRPALREALWSLATTMDLKFDYLESINSREDFDRCLRSLLANPHQFKNISSAQMQSLFEIWNRIGDRAALMTALETNKSWLDDGWRILAEYYARESRFEAACKIAAPYLPSIPRTPAGASTDIKALERAMLFSPADPRPGIDLFQAQKNKGDIDGALRTLEKIVALPDAPAYVRQEMAALYISKQDYRRAWENLHQAMMPKP